MEDVTSFGCFCWCSAARRSLSATGRPRDGRSVGDVFGSQAAASGGTRRAGVGVGVPGSCSPGQGKADGQTMSSSTVCSCGFRWPTSMSSSPSAVAISLVVVLTFSGGRVAGCSAGTRRRPVLGGRRIFTGTRVYIMPTYGRLIAAFGPIMGQRMCRNLIRPAQGVGI